jgi:hypothetical protein
MIHLIFTILAICTSIALFLSKTNETSIVRKQRQHFKLLGIDKEVIGS